MQKHVLMIGFDPNVRGLPAKAEVIRAGLDESKKELDDEGLLTDLCLLNKDANDAELLTHALQIERYDIVCVGAGVRVLPEHTLIFERVMNQVHLGAPQAKLCFNTTPADTVNAVRRAAGVADV